MKKNGVDANEETLERGRRKASRVPRRVMPLFAQLFSVVVVVVVLAYVWSVFARFCVVACVNVQHKNNNVKKGGGGGGGGVFYQMLLGIYYYWDKKRKVGR